MRIGVAPILASPMPLIPISCTRLIQVVAGILHQEFLRCVAEGKTRNRNIFYSHQLLVEVVVTVSATWFVKILNLRSAGSCNACMQTKKSGSYRGCNKMTFTGEMSAADVRWLFKNSQRKVAPSGLMVALRLVDGKLAILVLLAPRHLAGRADA